MFSYIFMKILESRPTRYDKGINILTGGHAKRVKKEIVDRWIKPGMEVLDIPGVTGDLNNDYMAQAIGALEALLRHDMVVIHVEATDEAAHAGLANDKIDAIQGVDKEIVARLRTWDSDALHVLILPDHSTPIEIQTHVADPVPFILWGPGFIANGAKRFTEIEAKGTGVFINEGYNIMGKLVES